MGGLFSIYGAGKTFECATDMEPWFNQKLRIVGTGDVTGCFDELVMCHMNLSLRNFLLEKAGRLWILDWAWAGFFPPTFEIASLSHKRADHPDFGLAQDLLRELGKSSADEELLSLLLVE
ncbi:hypothetical protein EJ04DRAFT_566408 [Polyplosphaeria fusca]|uniref:Aminoglycoside phosphotransferase domain-containing protein n=1 Tax=Polyplosphaeria fusca TaxID=682080 RepID=A0A9P4UZ11_9PLEO|nr:hypothetical protein EJ04DRAFT_566408 [Polyplosphaeria fusca]